MEKAEWDFRENDRSGLDFSRNVFGFRAGRYPGVSFITTHKSMITIVCRKHEYDTNS